MIAALICGAVSLTLFGLHCVTSSRYQHWVTLPEHLRIGIVMAGVLFMWRSINLMTLPALELRGHANAEAILTGGVLLYVLVSTAIWAAREFRLKRESERAPARGAVGARATISKGPTAS